MSDLQGIYMSFDLLTPEKAKEAWDTGYRVFSEQIWTGAIQPDNRVINLRNALNQGFILVAPIAISAGKPGSWHVNEAIAGIPLDILAAISLMPIDIELENITPQNIRSAVERTVELGKRRALYYSIHTWVDFEGDAPGFTDCLAYVAKYDWIDSTAFVALPPSMQGAIVVGKQYTNTEPTGSIDETCKEVWDSRILTPTATLPVEPGDPAINFLTKIAISHEQRIQKLEGK